MDIRHQLLEINDEDTTALMFDAGLQVKYFVNLTVQNISESTDVFIGGPGVTSGSYGIKLAAGSTATFEGFQRHAPLYAITGGGSASVAVMQTSQ